MALSDLKCGNCKDRACTKNFSIKNSLVKVQGLERREVFGGPRQAPADTVHS